MPIIYKVTTNKCVPRIRLSRVSPNLSSMSLWEGDYKAHLSPNSPFILESESDISSKQFCHLASGVLAISEDAYAECEDFYYSIAAGGSEILSAITSDGLRLVLINPTSFFRGQPANMPPFDYQCNYSTLFRISGQPPDQIFCISGSPLSGDDFKKVYDENGFKGLCFEKVWEDMES